MGFSKVYKLLERFAGELLMAAFTAEFHGSFSECA